MDTKAFLEKYALNPRNIDGDKCLQLLLEDLQAPQPHQELVRRELTHTMNTLLGMLDARQQQVLRLYRT